MQLIWGYESLHNEEDAQMPIFLTMCITPNQNVEPLLTTWRHQELG
jgi:hypothetical protein